jgi:hypothetical protein
LLKTIQITLYIFADRKRKTRKLTTLLTEADEKKENKKENQKYKNIPK